MVTEHEKRQAALERLEEGPVYTVYLDAGSFNWLVEILQAKARYQVWMKPYQRLVKRTLLSFEDARRAAAVDVNGLDAAPRKRTIPRKSPKSRSRK